MQPKYQRVADALRRAIAANQYQDGDALPTEAELKEMFSVSRQTVRQALLMLESDGLVVRRRGSGNYISHGPRKKNGTANVAVISTYITDYIFPSIVRGIESVLSCENCLMSLSATYNQVERERALLKRFLETPVDGLIVEGTKTAIPNPNIELYETLRERNIPFVFLHGYYPQLSAFPYVVTDDEEGGRQAVEILLEKGHKRIGGVFKSDDMQGHLRYQGYISALRRNDLPVLEPQICWFTTENKSVFLKEHTGKAFLENLAGNADALVCYNDEIAVQILSRLRQLAIAVPGDISLISFDNSNYAGICTPRLASLNHPKEEFGRIAAQKLLRMMEGRAETSTVLAWTLKERESIRNRNP